MEDVDEAAWLLDHFDQVVKSSADYVEGCYAKVVHRLSPYWFGLSGA
jgi:hypothetical protein